MTATVTDNGSNFIKAFQMFKADLGAQEEEGEDNEMEESEVNFIDLHQLLAKTDTETENRQFALPTHHWCASHTFNLISTNDVDKWLTANVDSKAVYRSAVAQPSGPRPAAPQWPSV